MSQPPRYYGGMKKRKSLSLRETADTTKRVSAPPAPGGVKVVKLDDPQTWNMYAYVGNNPISRNDPSGLSDLVYDGESDTLYFINIPQKRIYYFGPANNRSVNRTLPYLPDGTYAFHDKTAPHMHGRSGGDTEQGSFGPYGIFRVEDFKAFGKLHTGVGVHSGRADDPDQTAEHGKGVNHCTNGCVRTETPEMKAIEEIAPKDPLQHLFVFGNNPGDKNKQPSIPVQRSMRCGSNKDAPCGGGAANLTSGWAGGP